MNIYKRELRGNIKSIIGWLAAICGFGTMYMSFFPVFRDDYKTFLKYMDDMPDVMKEALKININTLGTIMGYFAFTLTIVSLLAAIQSCNLGVAVLSREEREKTADFLLTKPVSRCYIFGSKVLSAMTVFIINTIVYTTVMFAVMSLIGDSFSKKTLLLLTFSVFLLQMMFFAIGIFISMLLKKVKAVLPISLGIVFLFYAVNAFLVPQHEYLRYITPFSYFLPMDIIGNGYELKFVIACTVVIITLITGAYVLYKKRNIHAV